MLAMKFDGLRSVAGKMFAGLLAPKRMEREGALRLEEKLLLGPKKTLYLVHCKGRDLVIAAGTDSIVSMIELSRMEAGTAILQQKQEKLS